MGDKLGRAGERVQEPQEEGRHFFSTGETGETAGGIFRRWEGAGREGQAEDPGG